MYYNSSVIHPSPWFTATHPMYGVNAVFGVVIGRLSRHNILLLFNQQSGTRVQKPILCMVAPDTLA